MKRSRRKQRGAIAVEFALVLPLFLCALGLVMNTGLSFYARFQLTNYVQAAARYCVSQVNVDQGTLSGCVKSYMDSLDLQHMDGVCSNVIVTPSVVTGPNINKDMKVLQVDAGCDVLWSSMANISATNPQTRDGTWRIGVTASMPFQAINF